MHPVKAEEAIAEAYFEHGVKTFSLDTIDELDKIVRATATNGVAATDLNLLRPPAGELRPFEAQPRRQVRRRAGGGAGAAVRRPPGFRRARHLLPCRQPGDVARPPMPRRWSASARRSSRRRSRSTSSTSAAASRRPIRAWSLRRSKPISRRSTARSKRCRSAIRPSSGASPAAPCAPNMRAARARRKAPRGRALHQRRRLWRAVRRCAYRLALSR